MGTSRLEIEEYAEERRIRAEKEDIDEGQQRRAAERNARIDALVDELTARRQRLKPL